MQTIRRSVLTGVAMIGVAVAGSFVVARAEAQVVPPQPLEHAQPAPPKNRFGLPMEGWVVLRYTIRPDGRTENVRAIDHMPPQLSEREAVAAVEAWTFEPATAGGKPVEWHNNESVIVYDDEMVPFEPSPFFLQAYREADEQIKAEDYDKALKRNASMLAMATSRLAEVGLGEMQNTVINLRLGDLQAAYAAVLRATDPRVTVLTPDDLKVALQYRNVLELELGDAVGALETLRRRNEIEPVADDDAMAARADAIEKALGGDAPIAIKAKILDDAWSHRPARRTLELGEVDGDIKRVRFDCDRREQELEYMPDSAWMLPESWGACTVNVEGRHDTTFVFYEFP